MSFPRVVQNGQCIRNVFWMNWKRAADYAFLAFLGLV